jgi:hypothetical protein
MIVHICLPWIVDSSAFASVSIRNHILSLSQGAFDHGVARRGQEAAVTDAGSSGVLRNCMGTAPDF